MAATLRAGLKAPTHNQEEIPKPEREIDLAQEGQIGLSYAQRIGNALAALNEAGQLPPLATVKEALTAMAGPRLALQLHAALAVVYAADELRQDPKPATAQQYAAIVRRMHAAATANVDKGAGGSANVDKDPFGWLIGAPHRLAEISAEGREARQARKTKRGAGAALKALTAEGEPAKIKRATYNIYRAATVWHLRTLAVTAVHQLMAQWLLGVRHLCRDRDTAPPNLREKLRGLNWASNDRLPQAFAKLTSIANALQAYPPERRRGQCGPALEPPAQVAQRRGHRHKLSGIKRSLGADWCDRFLAEALKTQNGPQVAVNTVFGVRDAELHGGVLIEAIELPTLEGGTLRAVRATVPGVKVSDPDEEAVAALTKDRERISREARPLIKELQALTAGRGGPDADARKAELRSLLKPLQAELEAVETRLTAQRKRAKGQAVRVYYAPVSTPDTEFLYRLTKGAAAGSFDLGHYNLRHARNEDGTLKRVGKPSLVAVTTTQDVPSIKIYNRPDLCQAAATKYLYRRYHDIHQRLFGGNRPVISPYTFRNLFSAVQKEAGTPLAELAAVMGQQSDRMPQQYGTARQAAAAGGGRPVVVLVSATSAVRHTARAGGRYRPDAAARRQTGERAGPPAHRLP